jgi:hypothetical protein
MIIRIIILISTFCTSFICKAQTKIEEIQDGSFLQIGFTGNNRVAFAGQAMGITGPELLPYFYLQHKSGVYASIGSSLYTDATITKKTNIADADFTLGYNYSSPKFSSDNSFSRTQVFYGNKFFKSFLNNAISSENTYSITDNLDASINAMLLFSKAKKVNIAPLLEANLQYHFYIQNALGAQQLRISPNCSYYYGSNLIAASNIARDSISDKSKKVTTSTALHALSIIPGVDVNWQRQHHEIELGLQLPIASAADVLIANTYSYKTASPIFSIRYYFYLGFGDNE